MSIPPDEQVALLNRLMRELIGPNLPDGIGATLFLFPMRKDVTVPESAGLISYISNASRDDMKVAMRRLLERWDEQQDKKDGLFDGPKEPT